MAAVFLVGEAFVAGAFFAVAFAAAGFAEVTLAGFDFVPEVAVAFGAIVGFIGLAACLTAGLFCIKMSSYVRLPLLYN